MNTRKVAAFILLMLLAAPAAPAQAERWEPFVPRPDMTGLRVWTSGNETYVRVVFTFPTGGYRVTEVGPVARQGRDLSVDFAVERWTGGATQGIVLLEYFFNLGALAAEQGAFTFNVRSRGAGVTGVTFDPRQVVERWEEASLERNGVGFTVWTVGGVTFTGVTLNFPDEGYRVPAWEPPARAGNDFVSRVRLERFTGYASALRRASARRIFVLGQLPPHETFTVSVEFSGGVRHSSAPFTPAGTARPAGTNPLDDPAFFVRQQYLDFIGREADPEGLTFWYDELTNSCLPPTAECVERRRESVSAAFYLSIEFQQTGYFVYRLYKAAYGRAPRFDEFLADTRKAGEGVVVGRDGWEATVEGNRRRLVEEFAARAEFRARYPETMTPEQYVAALDRMIAHDFSELEAGPLTAAERQQLADGLRAGTETRATVLRRLAEHEQFRRQEFNRAFVLMQYFGYLRRNPDDAPDTNLDGYRFWLNKLLSHGGDFRAAEMVRSFLVSQEYRSRFRQN